MIKKISLALLVLGILLAPVYWIHGKFYTGQEALQIPLARDTALVDGRQVWRSAPFELRPEMAPAGFLLLAEGHFSPNMDEGRPPKDMYTATLVKGDSAAQPLAFSLAARNVSDSNPAFKEHLLLMQRVQGGSYRVEVSSVNPPDIQIDSMRLQVRQHVREPDPRLVTAGIVAFVLGLMGLAMG